MQIEHFRQLKDLVEATFKANPQLFSGSSGPQRTTHGDMVLLQLGHVYHVRYVNAASPESGNIYTVGVVMDGPAVHDILINNIDAPMGYNAKEDHITHFRSPHIHDKVIELFDHHFKTHQ